MAGKKAKPVKHVGFKGAVKSVMKKGDYSEESAERIIGAGKAHASAAARARNSRLSRTGGRTKKG